MKTKIAALLALSVVVFAYVATTSTSQGLTCLPTPTYLPWYTRTPGFTPTKTPTATPTSTATPTPWIIPTPWATLPPCYTSTPGPSPTPTSPLPGPSPTPRPTSTPLTYYRCAMKITNVSTESLTIEVWSNTAISGTYWININYSDPPCKPWKRDGAQVWIVDEELDAGEYTVQWLEPMSIGQEACINWMCKPGAGTPCVYVGQDYKMLYDYIYLPLVLGD